MARQRTATRRRMAAPERREQVLDVARTIVAEQGFNGVSIQSVARAAGVTRPIVYEHFGDLDGLLEALVDREMKRSREQIETTALGDLGDGDAVALMLESLGRYLAAVEENPDTWRLVLAPPEEAPPGLRRRIRRGRERVRRGLTEAVGPGFPPGALADDPELTARTLSAMADEYALMVIEDPARFPPARLLEHAQAWLEHVAV
ncbi:MAG TPA: TetR/AcrR family transcriptional regulator [Solirubrobacteraceae bacterium]|nr:TetR/AcrR family transcriptional regulator [Solirubrobacteraceae bacterium]